MVNSQVYLACGALWGKGFCDVGCKVCKDGGVESKVGKHDFLSVRPVGSVPGFCEGFESVV